jgi:tRNA dimethylallyltransferase
VHLLSADSRQVYRGLENLTGADLPTNFTTTKNNDFTYPYFTNPNQNIFLHGISIIDASDDWSVAHFQRLFTQIKSQLNHQEILIVVGGTGFYQQQIMDTAATLSVPQNLKLRQKLAKLSITKLQNQLENLAHKKLESMNNSDLNNPRRLVRAIEVALYKIEHPTTTKQISTQAGKIFYLVLPKTIREVKIKQRVLDRFTLAKREVEKQLHNQTLSALAASCTGFIELQQFINKEIDQETCLAKWQVAEVQYAKRQDTWWKKRSGLIRIDAEDTKKIADKIIDTCYI